jgi:hypothetical protein
MLLPSTSTNPNAIWHNGSVVVDRQKLCLACNEVKLITEFHTDKSRLNGLSAYCRPCNPIKTIARRERIKQEDPERWSRERAAISATFLAKKYGMTVQDYKNMLETQNGVCAICTRPERSRDATGKVRPLSVDHDHACCSGSVSCGKCVRGLLCNDCNTGIGKFSDDINRLTSAVAYLLRGESYQD